MFQDEEDRRSVERDGFRRRAHDRRRCLLAGFLVRPGSSHVERVGVRNLSDGGAKLMLDGLGIVPEGAVLVVPKLQRAHALEVVWRELPQAGVRFTGPRDLADPTLQAALRAVA